MTALPSFLGLPDRLDDGQQLRAVIFAAGHGSTYPGQDSSGHALDGRPVSSVDAGDIDGLSALTAARILVNVIGTIVRQV